MKRMESLFTDLEHERRIEVSRLNGGLLLGHILEYLENPYIHPETGHKVQKQTIAVKIPPKHYHTLKNLTGLR